MCQLIQQLSVCLPTETQRAVSCKDHMTATQNAHVRGNAGSETYHRSTVSCSDARDHSVKIIERVSYGGR